MKINDIKAGVIAIFAVINAWLGMIAPVLYLLVVLGITDYVTGLAAAPYRGESRNSGKGIRGIIKKVFMLVLVGVGMALDWLLMYAANYVGISTPFKFALATLIAIWLICNEILSIIENISDTGTSIPPFLKPLVEWVKQQAEEKGKKTGV